MQRKAWSRHKAECRIVEVFETTDRRGKGMRARRKVAAGELLIKEKPLGRAGRGFE